MTNPTTQIIRQTFIDNAPEGVTKEQAATAFDRWLEQETGIRIPQYSDDPSIDYSATKGTVENTAVNLMLMHDRIALTAEQLEALKKDRHSGLSKANLIVVEYLERKQKQCAEDMRDLIDSLPVKPRSTARRMIEHRQNEERKQNR